ncbi:unnamed protein product, partial [Brenthis ino]
MCRWVVEVVNGRLKRDFKLFRQEFFNKSAKHLMIDFRNGCALTNKLHPLIEDIPEAAEYLAIAMRVNRSAAAPRTVIYLDETYIHASYGVTKCWKSEDEEGVLSSDAKGALWITMHAGG